MMRSMPMGLPIATAAALLLLTACSGSSATSARTPSPPPAARPSSLPHPLPPGFSTPGSRALPPLPGLLRVAAVTHLNPKALHPGPFPGSQIRRFTQAIADQPVRAKVRPLLVSAAAFRPGLTLTVAAGDLPDTPHDVLFVLQGPALREQQRVRVEHGVAVGAVTLPRSLPRGTWALAAEDLSGVRTAGRKRPTGTVLLDLTIFTINR